MDGYMKNFDSFEKIIVYNFELGAGGIGDCIKFFIFTLNFCIKYNYKLYYQINNILLEKYLILKYVKMYITKDDVKNISIIHDVNSIPNINNNYYNIVKPHIFYGCFNYDSININIQDVFYFSDEIKLNNHNLLLENITNYISIHLRLGDKYLETDKSFVLCTHDVRNYNETKLFKCIEENSDKNILFFCDNKSYKLKIKKIYDNVIITNCDIGHTSLSNTTDKQILDSVTEFYLMANSEKIFAASESGFSIISSKFKNIPLIKLY